MVHLFGASAAYFLDEPIGGLNDQVFDLGLLLGGTVRQLYTRLQETNTTTQRLTLLESFLLQRLTRNNKKTETIDAVKR